MSGKKQLTLREQAILSRLWIITKEERDSLDRFFLLHDTWENLKLDISFSDEEICYYLQHEGNSFKMIFLTPLHRVRVAPELGLSFRINWATGFHYVLVKEWREEQDSNEKAA